MVTLEEKGHLFSSREKCTSSYEGTKEREVFLRNVRVYWGSEKYPPFVEVLCIDTGPGDRVEKGV